MTMIRKIALPSTTAVALLATMGFALAQSGGGGSAGTNDKPAAEMSPTAGATTGKPKMKAKKAKRTSAKSNSRPKGGAPLGPTQTRS